MNVFKLVLYDVLIAGIVINHNGFNEEKGAHYETYC